MSEVDVVYGTFCVVELDSVVAYSVDVRVSICFEEDGPSFDITVVLSTCVEGEGVAEESVACNLGDIDDAVLKEEAVSSNKIGFEVLKVISNLDIEEDCIVSGLDVSSLGTVNEVLLSDEDKSAEPEMDIEGSSVSDGEVTEDDSEDVIDSRCCSVTEKELELNVITVYVVNVHISVYSEDTASEMVAEDWRGISV